MIDIFSLLIGLIVGVIVGWVVTLFSIIWLLTEDYREMFRRFRYWESKEKEDNK